MGVGLWFLLNPELPGASMYSSDVINLQRLSIGQTFTLVGAIFLAVGIRPRR
jgi:hypothetical protein